MDALTLPTAIPRKALIYSGLMAGLTILFWLIGPPSSFQSPAATLVRLVYVGLMGVCAWLIFAALPLVRSLWRWLGLAALAIILKVEVFSAGASGDSYASNVSRVSPANLGVVAISLIYFSIPALLVFWLWNKRRKLHEPERRRERGEKVHAETGYRPPVLWHGAQYQSDRPSTFRRINPRNPHVYDDLVTPALLAQRSKMPPFILWYEEGAEDGKKPGGFKQGNIVKWVSCMDGNPQLGKPGPNMPVFVQYLFRHQSELSLFETTREDAKKLTAGPYGRVTLHGRFHPDNGNTTLDVQGGTPGASMPLPPRQPGTTHGSSNEGTGDTDAERA